MGSMQVILTPAQGKKLIARAVLAREDVQTAAREHTLVVVAGSTNAPIAYGLLQAMGCGEDFSPEGFLRGAIRPAPKQAVPFMGDVVIEKGVYQKGKTVLDVAASLGKGDMILKGANAVDLQTGETAVLIGSPVLGTAGGILPAVVGRGAALLVPVGVEKRISGLADACRRANAPGHTGPGLLPLPGEAVTEPAALRALFGVEATLVAAGGIDGFEGAAVFSVTGEAQALGRCRALLAEL